MGSSPKRTQSPPSSTALLPSQTVLSSFYTISFFSGHRKHGQQFQVVITFSLRATQRKPSSQVFSANRARKFGTLISGISITEDVRLVTQIEMNVSLHSEHAAKVTYIMEGRGKHHNLNIRCYDRTTKKGDRIERWNCIGVGCTELNGEDSCSVSIAMPPHRQASVSAQRASLS